MDAPVEKHVADFWGDGGIEAIDEVGDEISGKNLCHIDVCVAETACEEGDALLP